MSVINSEAIVTVAEHKAKLDASSESNRKGLTFLTNYQKQQQNRPAAVASIPVTSTPTDRVTLEELWQRRLEASRKARQARESRSPDAHTPPPSFKDNVSVSPVTFVVDPSAATIISSDSDKAFDANGVELTKGGGEKEGSQDGQVIDEREEGGGASRTTLGDYCCYIFAKLTDGRDTACFEMQCAKPDPDVLKQILCDLDPGVDAGNRDRVQLRLLADKSNNNNKEGGAGSSNSYTAVITVTSRRSSDAALLACRRRSSMCRVKPFASRSSIDDKAEDPQPTAATPKAAIIRLPSFFD